MASNNKKNQPIEHNSSSSSDSSIDPWLLPSSQDLMEGQDDMELIPTQDLQCSPTPKKKQSKKASKSLSAASMDMFHTQPSTSSNYDPLLGTIDLTNTEASTSTNYDRLLGTIDLTNTEVSTSTNNEPLLGTSDFTNT